MYTSTEFAIKFGAKKDFIRVRFGQKEENKLKRKRHQWIDTNSYTTIDQQDLVAEAIEAL